MAATGGRGGGGGGAAAAAARTPQPRRERRRSSSCWLQSGERHFSRSRCRKEIALRKTTAAAESATMSSAMLPALLRRWLALLGHQSAALTVTQDLFFATLPSKLP